MELPAQRAPRRLRSIAIVPAYNEAESLGTVLEEIRAADPELDVVVVNDGSTDATRERGRGGGRGGRLAALQPRHRRRRADRLPVRARARLRASRSRSTATGSTTRSEITQVLEPILDGRADLVVGHALRHGRRLPGHAPPARRDPHLRGASSRCSWASA